MSYHRPPPDYRPPTACEACGCMITFGPGIGGHVWSHLVDRPDDLHIVQMRPEGYFDTFTGETVYGNPLRRQRLRALAHTLGIATPVMDDLARETRPTSAEGPFR